MCRQPLIIGAGPAGCAAAIALASRGHPPVVVERSTGPTDKVCGDFLGADTIARAQALGVDAVGLGAVAISHVRLVHGRRETESPLPFPALSLSRRVFDQALLDAAKRAGSELLGGQTVRLVTRTGEGWAVTLGGPPAESRLAGTIFLATGKHDLRDRPRPRNAKTAVGLKQYLHLSDRARVLLGEATELTLFPGGYAGLQPVEASRTALCIAVRRDTFQSHGGTWDQLLAEICRLCPRFAALLTESRPILPKPLAVAGVPYGFLHRRTDDGVFRLGDQAAVIPSLTGDGLAIALHSGRLAAETWMAGGDAHRFHTVLHQALAGQMRLSGALHAAFLSPLFQPLVLRAAAIPGLVRQAALLTRVGSG
ncbi:MAG TPA: FAD-dependent monooxygenase [Rhodopila sp.]|jgi:flavin-dependent dehydrogenase|nr:FAD-dependent monooxygenase [Rhodopila sp.]